MNIVSDEWATTGGPEPEPFLRYDSGCEGTQRVILFAPSKFLPYICSASHWHWDGNFKLAPTHFMQLYCLRVCVAGRMYITGVYAWMEGKSKESYKILFQSLLDLCLEEGYHPSVSYIHVDFEIAAILALKMVFGPHINITA
jgi:hypothetical protein